MAIAAHIVRIAHVPVDATGTVLNKNEATVQQMMKATHELRVLPDSAVTNSAGHPTIEAYLAAEAGDDFILGHVSQNLIVTYDAGDINAAS